MSYRGSVHRRAYTLAELVVSMAVATIVLGGSISAILIASHALPDDQASAGSIARVSDTASQLAEELTYALHFTERTGTSVGFMVADRDGDASPERIRYAWSGTPEEPGPLTRQYNDGPEVAVLDDVQQFNLAYDLRAATEEYPGPPVESGRVLFVVLSTAPGLKTGDIAADKWLGEYFHPNGFSSTPLPSDVLSWSVESVFFRAIQDGNSDGQTLVSVHPVTAQNTPDTTTVLGQVTVDESTLPDGYFTYKMVDFDSVTNLSPDQGLCFVLSTESSGKSMKTQYHDGPVNLPNTGMLVSNDVGASWQLNETAGLRFSVYGRYTTPGPAQTATRHYVTNVRLVLRAGGDPAFPVETAVATLNTPEVLSAVWELDFDTDPTALDMNGDGDGDWVVDGGSFDPATLYGRVWHADVTLRTVPDNDFTELTTVDVKFRDATQGGEGAGVLLHVDRAETTCGIILATVARQADDTQTLTVSTESGPGQTQTLVACAGLSADVVQLRLLVDPDTDIVNIKVNGEDKGTFFYQQSSRNNRTVELYPAGYDSGAEFDYVRIRVGGNGS